MSQRLSISRLPNSALLLLDKGAITREEALALTKLQDHPELIEACLEPSGKYLKVWLGAHVSNSIGSRVQAVMRAFELERQRNDWEIKMRAAGHSVLEQVPKDGDRRFVKLTQGSEAARAHQNGKLSCEAWGWDNGRPVRYCTKPEDLQGAIARIPGIGQMERARQEERHRIEERRRHEMQ